MVVLGSVLAAPLTGCSSNSDGPGDVTSDGGEDASDAAMEGPVDAHLDVGSDASDAGMEDSGPDGAADAEHDTSVTDSGEGGPDGDACAPLACSRYCAGGLAQDQSGCDVCECRYDVVMTRVEDVSTSVYGSFASHNQRIVETAGGLFMTYQVDESGGDGNGTWKLVRSQDGGLTWSLVHTAPGTRPPAVVADNAGNVHLVTSDPTLDRLHLYSFGASGGYALSSHHPYDGVPCAAKFTALYDPKWNNVYVGTQYGRFLAIWLDTFGVIHDYQVFQHYPNDSPHACAQYPQLAVDAGGNIHLAVTTSNLVDTHVYRNILHVYATPNPDGTLSWRRMPRPGESQPSYTPLPIQPDENGAALEINDYDERGAPGIVSVHLTNFIVKESFVHFYYTVVRTGTSEWLGHYKRFNRFTGNVDVNLDADLAPISGDMLSLTPNGGFFCTDDIAAYDSPLYLTSGEVGRGQIATLVSRDNGMSWHDHAVTDVGPFQKSNISGARHSDGRVFIAYNTMTTTPAYPLSIMFLGFYPK
jgi:hypothetical protein